MPNIFKSYNLISHINKLERLVLLIHYAKHYFSILIMRVIYDKDYEYVGVDAIHLFFKGVILRKNFKKM